MAGEPWQQALLIIIFVLVIICVVRPLVFFRGKKYEFSINFAVSPLLGVLAGLATTVISPQMIKDGVEGNANVQPYSILILFFSLSYISIAIDVTGAFAFIALVATRYSQKSGKGLFITFFVLSALLTLASNNDIVILTLTPIIIYFCRAMVSVSLWLRIGCSCVTNWCFHVFRTWIQYHSSSLNSTAPTYGVLASTLAIQPILSLRKLTI